MKHLVLIALTTLLTVLLTPSSVFASSLQTYKDSNHSSQSESFDPGQTVYAKLNSSSSGGKVHVLNVRDNNYNLITSYNFSKSGGTFTASFQAPQSSGIYSLEAKLEDDGENEVAVRTIKVGSTSNGNSSVKVLIENTVNGSTSYTKTESQSSSTSTQSTTKSPTPTPKANPTPSPSASPEPEIEQEVLGVKVETEIKDDSILVRVTNILKGILLFVFLPL